MRARPRRSLALAGALALVGGTVPLGLGGCGLPIITFQGEETTASGAATAKVGAAEEPATTGSIEKRPLGFGPDLGAEDWRRAKAALAVALDPQGNGRPVKWDNPETTLRGSVNPTSLPYVANDHVCRDFLASVIAPARSRFVRGTGCKPSGGDWTLTRIRVARSGG